MILNTTEEILGSIERGDLSADFAAEVQKVLQALHEAGDGKGSVTLRLNFALKDEFTQIKADLEAKLPKKKRRTSNYFVTGDGRLSLQHPDQIDMFAGPRPRVPTA